MGRVYLVYRLAARDLRRHVIQAVLFLITVATAAALLTLAFALNGVTNQPFEQTSAATRGPDAVAYLTSPAQAPALTGAHGVTGSSGPYPLTSASLHFAGRTADALIQGRGPQPARVDQPDVLAGTWVRPGAIVLERTFADALGIGVGGHLTLDARTFQIAGIAVTAAEPPYPNLCNTTVEIQRVIPGQGTSMLEEGACATASGPSERNTGLVWTTESDATALAAHSGAQPAYVLNLTLADPATAPAFADAHSSFSPSGPVIGAWQNVAAADALLVADAQSVLKTGALLLGLLALASVAVLVGSRLTGYGRRVGLLKAVGATPGVVAATFLAENLALALVAACTGLAAGWLTAPLLTDPGAGLVGSAGSPSLTIGTVLVVAAVSLGLSLAATLVPALRAARTSTVSALADAPRPPKRRSTLIRISNTLPVPALFGLRLVARRPPRALLSAASIAVTVMGVVAVLTFHADADGKLSSFGPAGTLGDPVISRDEQMLTVITVLLLTLAALTAVFTAWATVLDARRAAAVTLALGATPRQVRAGLVMAQLFSALPGAILGVPLGIGLFKIAAKGLTGQAPALWLIAAVLATLLLVAALTTVPARLATRRPPAEALHAETP